MRRSLIRSIFVLSLGSLTWIALRSESNFPDYVLESIQLLKKPIEDLLPDIQDDPIDSAAILAASLELEPYLELKNQRTRWNEMRAMIESGQPLRRPLPSELALSTSAAGGLAPEVPPPPGFTVQLPYESRLTVSGRKTIGFAYRSSNFTNASYAQTQGRPSGTSNFEIEQQLQVRINGQVGRKVTINVDFDDTKEDKKDISIVYKGDPDEIVQRAAFGDINMSLPQTEFAGYSKQVFGAAAELKYKALRGYLIGSRTKGETETKEFTGNVILQRVNIPDTSYIRRRFYNYTQLTGHTTDKNINVDTLKLYIDTQDSTRPDSAEFQRFPVDLSLIPNLPGTAPPTYPSDGSDGMFKELIKGIDYSVDASSGLIVLRTPVNERTVLAVDYTVPSTGQSLASEGSGRIKAIKWDETSITAIPLTEERTHYSIGSIKLVRDNGQGNFTMQLRDLGDKEIGSQYGVLYQLNNQGQIQVDFDAGTFQLTSRLPTPDFDSVYLPTPTSRSRFFVEYRSRVKTYTLRPNIVINSERIVMNGRTLVRDQDYLIDYESGFIQFFNEDQITESTRITATYDFSPFGIAGEQTDTLVGARTEVSMAPIAPILASSLIGGTVIYNFAPKQAAAPDIRQTSGSFLVTEADAAFKDLMFSPFPLLKSSLTAEMARSERNPNTFGKAIIDNMEGIKDDTSISLSKLSWQVAANPTRPGGQYVDAMGVVNTANNTTDNLTNELIPTLDINPSASALSSDRTLVLNVRYDLTRSSEASIATVLSPTGVDFSKKQYLEMWVKGDGTAVGSGTRTRLNLTLGQISENFDNSSPASVKTEDLNSNNSLDAGEDIGILFRNPDGNSTALGAGNLRIDSNDLDRNGVLTNSDNVQIGGNIGYLNASSPINFSGSSLANAVDHAGWQFVRVPLNISTQPVNAASWSAIKTVRLSLQPYDTFGATGTISIAKIAVVGNRWEGEPAVFGSTVSAKAVNNEDDTNYFSPSDGDFNDLNQVNQALTGPVPDKRREQSLGLNFTATSGSTVSVKNVSSAMDFTSYGSIRFYVQPRSSSTFSYPAGSYVFYRAGSDTDYWEFRFPLDQLAADQWRQLKINQTGSTRPDAWESGTPGGEVRKVGNPNLASVSQQKFGVFNGAGTTADGELWINELFASDVITRVGYAKRMNADFQYFGWGTFGLGLRDIDRNFETFTSALSNQDRREENAYLTLERLSWFPMKFTGTRRRTITPGINQIGNSSLVSILQEGRVKENRYTADGTLQIPRLPKFTMNFATGKISSDNLFRSDKNDTIGVVMDYPIPVKRRYLPGSIQVGYRLNRLKLDFGSGALANATDPFNVSDTETRTQDITANASFQPASGFTFTPTFSRSNVREEKDVLYSTSTVDGSTETIKYDKSKSQTIGLDGTLGFVRWFSPRLRYSIQTSETYGLPQRSNLLASSQKTVTRTGNTDATWDFAWRDLTRRVRALQSLSAVTTFSVEDGDTWEQVSGGYGTFSKLSVRQTLNSGVRRQMTIRDTLRSTQRWNPFDWATHWSGPLQPWRTMSVTHTYSEIHQRTDTTGTKSRINTRVLPDFIIGLSQTEQFFAAQRWMSNSQMNVKGQYRTVDTVDRTLQKSRTLGGDWRFTVLRKLDLFTNYTLVTDRTEDKVNRVTSNNSSNETLGLQLAFNVGKWRLTGKYDQNTQKAKDSSGRLTSDLRSRKPSLQAYADLFLPAGLRLPFSDMIVFSNRIRTTNTISLDQKRSSLNSLSDNTDTYQFTTSNDYEITPLIRLSLGGSYAYTSNKQSSQANSYTYEINSLLTIQF